jgi:hypothetical protein
VDAGGDVLRTYTEAEFDELSWHDCHLVGFEVRAGDVDEGDWTSDLVLDLDFIVEWICGVDGPGQFRVAPATLVFHGVTDLRFDIDWGRSGFQLSLHEISIDRIERQAIRDQKVHLDRPYYTWTIRLNWPKSGEISFGAVGFTQTLLAEPVRTEKQWLSRQERIRLIAGRGQLPR